MVVPMALANATLRISASDNKPMFSTLAILPPGLKLAKHAASGRGLVDVLLFLLRQAGAAGERPRICRASAGEAGRRSKRGQLSTIFFTSSALLDASRSGVARRLSSSPVRQWPPVARHH